MLERLLIVILLAGAGAAAYAALKSWHMHRATGVSAGRGIPSVLYFRSDSCAPCVTQWRFLQQIQAQFGGQVSIEKIDADSERDKAERYGIFTLPTTLILDGTGAVKHINYGLADARKLVEQLQSVAQT